MSAFYYLLTLIQFYLWDHIAMVWNTRETGDIYIPIHHDWLSIRLNNLIELTMEFRRNQQTFYSILIKPN